MPREETALNDEVRELRDEHEARPPAALQARLDAGEAIVWESTLILPTYEPDEPSRFPMYLDNRVYQGSSGRVYPMPFVEGVAREATDHAWRAVHLENRYIRVTVLPELGGRIYTGYDKTTGYDFFYRNHVIKPALVGLDGPWISGGVEFNWPQHHRPGTYFPTDADLVLGDDGSATVWCRDHDPFARMTGIHGIRLHADRSVVEILGRFHNRTEQMQTFLWWANAAVRVHDDYQSFFPQDVGFVADHARRAITAFPQADRPYYGVDYPAAAAERPGADRIDRYANIPAPTSYMVVDTKGEFFGGYDHAAGAGVVHWADRRISPGKKQWTWGDSPFGHAWDRHLTDADGPYVELMAGVYTDNQPDFSWLRPGEVKRMRQVWFPIPAIGIAHQANEDAALHVSLEEPGFAGIRLAVTRPTAATVRVLVGRDQIWSDAADVAPGQVAEFRLALPEGTDAADVRVEVRSGTRLVLEWRLLEGSAEEPWLATVPPSPAETGSVDELYLTGLHLEQYRHPTRSPLPYWQEAIRRDPGDSRTRLALAWRAYRSGAYAEAEEHLRIAIARATARNERLRDTEPYYLLGLVLIRLDRPEEAAEAFGRASWDGAWHRASAFEGACLLARNGLVAQARRDGDAAAADGSEPRLAALRIVLARRDGDPDAAADVLTAELAAGIPDDLIRYLAAGTLPSDGGRLIDLALDLARFGERDAALSVLQEAALAPATPTGGHAAIAHYLRACLLEASGRSGEAAAARSDARGADRRWVFPAGLDVHDALVAALRADPEDAVAADLLGRLLYQEGRRVEASVLWERAVAGGAQDPVLLRNAGLAAYNVAHDDALAWARYEQARAAAPDDARLLSEQDQLAEKLGHPAEQRLARLRASADLVAQRDDLAVAYAELLRLTGDPQGALEWIDSRSFQPWEGGEGRVLAAWDAARAALGLPVADPPENLGEQRPMAVPPAAVHEDGSTDYFATSLPESMLFHRDVE
ncbi:MULTISPECIES: DUF5107 domain-containing protein [unclassified Microbacterium]|uniref:DUF5107 domain-containing protein n=1 Tax=unclassified Microbacterium TaxID=2609290 RepID=UPI001E3BFF5E|nr:DUF5107 domain-containing protein [Microbacterium sp. MAH-37]